MKFKMVLASVAAAVALLGGTPGVAQADDPITVTAVDIDATSNSCFYQQIRITGMTRQSPPYIIAFYSPDGSLLNGSTWNGTHDFDYVNGFCSSLTEGRYTIQVDGVTYGGFTVYRPHLDATVAPGGRSERRKHHARTAVAHLTIHGTPMASQPVLVRRHVSGHRKTQQLNRTTDAAGVARAKCPSGHRCTFQFDYGQGFALSQVVTVRKR